ncbi:MAG: YbaB/EbfC family nucleoid-associated protein [Candidatus Omnitrophota bacterium]
MFDKMKALMDMKSKMAQMKRELEDAVFEVSSSDGLIKVTMNGAQQAKEFKINGDLAETDKAGLEQAIKDACNRAIKRSQEVAAEKMKQITGLNLPGMF